MPSLFTYGNAVAAAKKPHLDALMAKYPMTTIEASGMAVGLPDGSFSQLLLGHFQTEYEYRRIALDCCILCDVNGKCSLTH